MSVQKFYGTINTDGIKDERGIETPSLSATGEVSGQTGVFTESVTAPAFSGDLTGDVTGDLTGTAAKATADAEGNVIPTTYATKEALAEETSAREAADETLSSGITAEATARAQEISALQTGLTGGTITVAEATHASSADNATNATTATNATNATTAATANTLAESGKYTSLWSGNWDGKSNLVVSGLSNYCAILVRWGEQYCVCYKTSTIGNNINYAFTEMMAMSDPAAATITSLILETTATTTSGVFSTLRSANINSTTIFKNSTTDPNIIATDTISTITEIWGIETLRVPT